MDLFQLFISSWLNLIEIHLFFQIFQFCEIFIGFYCNVSLPSVILLICVFSLFISLSQGLLVLPLFSKPTLHVMALSIVFCFQFINFCSHQIMFVCCFLVWVICVLSKALKYSAVHLTPSEPLTQVFTAINFPLGAVSILSHRFWCFNFHLFQNFKKSFLFFSDPGTVQDHGACVSTFSTWPSFPSRLFSTFKSLFVLFQCMRENTQYLSFYAWLISHIMMSSISIYFPENYIISF